MDIRKKGEKMNKELKCCPFCGGEARLCSFQSQTIKIYKEYWVKCINNCCQTMNFRSEEKAIEQWNTRKPIDMTVEELEEMIKPKEFYFCKYAKGGCKHLDNDEKDCTECAIEIAIEKIRKGGINV